jgi:hypothetical protein
LAYFSPVAYERHRRSPVVGSFLIEAGGLVEDQLFIRVTAQVTAIVNNQQYIPLQFVYNLTACLLHVGVLVSDVSISGQSITGLMTSSNFFAHTLCLFCV